MTGFGSPGYAGPERASRLGYLDWARGLAVLLMINTHAFSAWTVPEDRATRLFGVARLFGGYPAPLFLFLAGVSAALVAEKERTKGMDSREVRRRARRRGLTVLGYAFVFRLAMLASGGFGRAADLLRVDVLNCIAVSLILAAFALGRPSPTDRLVAALGLGAGVALLTPLAWDTSWWRGWPVPLAGYFTGRVPDALFPLFPWTAFLALGAACGLVLAHARARGREAATIGLMAAAGAAAIPIALWVDRHAPAVYPAYDFWHTSPSYVVLKGGVLLVLFGLAFLLDRLPGPSPLRQLGRTSLLVYWAHLEIVYGKWIAPGLRGVLSVEEAGVGVVILVLTMLALSVARTHARGGWRLRGGELAKA
ncbi:MAG TPA: heparan-alpha-glucosaminide N-acetyltransferase domain-containing protein [Vicinamibacteria bacterium]|nr:heparan-alpha-glucosaminide N-acetyltransferase domain-containing protein [Vicinamibacteria bacterium]